MHSGVALVTVAHWRDRTGAAAKCAALGATALGARHTLELGQQPTSAADGAGEVDE